MALCFSEGPEATAPWMRQRQPTFWLWRSRTAAGDPCQPPHKGSCIVREPKADLDAGTASQGLCTAPQPPAPCPGVADVGLSLEALVALHSPHAVGSPAKLGGSVTAMQLLAPRLGGHVGLGSQSS